MIPLRDVCATLCAEADTAYFHGPGASRKLAAELKRLGVRRPALVRGLRWLETSGHQRAITEAWDMSFSTVPTSPDPTVEGVGDLLSRLEDEGVDGFVAVGGGSVMDMAKVLSAFDPRTWDPAARGLDSKVRCRPWIAVPTTAGTGSEMTPYASFTGADGRKFSFDDVRLRPRAVVHDVELMVGQPRSVGAPAAADALSQSIESLWARAGTEGSRRLAFQALQTIRNHAHASVSGDPAACEQMQMAASLAGAAIGISRTTAVHAASYPFTARHGIAHGRALAALLPGFMAWTGPRLEKDVSSLIVEALGTSDWEGATDEVKTLLGNLGLPTTPRDFDLSPEDWDRVVRESGRPDRLKNHPAVPEPAELEILVRGQPA